MCGLKIDPDLHHICNFSAKDLILTGIDKGLKRYKLPDETIEKIDFKLKLPALAPIEDIPGHQVPINQIHL
jgi:hypothetical protein